MDPMEFARFKISGMKYSEMRNWMTAYETIGRSEKALMQKLESAFDKTQAVASDILGFGDIAAYTAIESNLFNMIREGILEEVRNIVNLHKIRRVPLGIALNHESTNEDLKLLGP